MWVALVSAPLSEELKVTSKMTTKAVAGAPAENDMMAAIVGPMLLQKYGGAEGVEMTVTIHEDGRMRTDDTAFDLPTGVKEIPMPTPLKR